MPDPISNPIPEGVRAIAAIFGVCGIYLASLGLTMLARPGLVSMSSGAPLLFGLELAGPYMFLLTAAIAGLIAWGLMRLRNLARRIATIVAIVGVVMLVPSVSGAVVMAQMKPLAVGGLGIIIRVIVAWYLSQGPIAEVFANQRRKSAE
jgi:hypothetical protein